MPSKKVKRIINRITFFGFASCKPGEYHYKETYKVAKLLAEHGYIIVNGGTTCTMEAGSKGAKSGGGQTIGITFYPEGRTNFEGRGKVNRWVDQEIKTRTYVERTLGLINMGDAYVVFNGGTGTISEFAMAWALAQIYYHDFRPLILYGDYWHDIIGSFKRNMLVRPTAMKVFKIVKSPKEVLEAIQSFEKYGTWRKKRMEAKRRKK